MPYLVFISHAWHDKWEAGQLRKELIAAGADCFLAVEGMETGDDFDRRIMQALEEAAELVVLLTPQALDRPYVWVEIGAARSRGIRIVGLLHHMSTESLVDYGAPGFLKSLYLRDINELDEYLVELRRRIDHG